MDEKLRFGIMAYDDLKRRTLEIARGTLRPAPDDPKIWFVSEESLSSFLASRRLLETGKSRRD